MAEWAHPRLAHHGPGYKSLMEPYSHGPFPLWSVVVVTGEVGASNSALQIGTAWIVGAHRKMGVPLAMARDTIACI